MGPPGFEPGFTGAPGPLQVGVGAAYEEAYFVIIRLTMQFSSTTYLLSMSSVKVMLLKMSSVVEVLL